MVWSKTTCITRGSHDPLTRAACVYWDLYFYKSPVKSLVFFCCKRFCISWADSQTISISLFENHEVDISFVSVHYQHWRGITWLRSMFIFSLRDCMPRRCIYGLPVVVNARKSNWAHNFRNWANRSSTLSDTLLPQSQLVDILLTGFFAESRRCKPFNNAKALFDPLRPVGPSSTILKCFTKIDQTHSSAYVCVCLYPQLLYHVAFCLSCLWSIWRQIFIDTKADKFVKM